MPALTVCSALFKAIDPFCRRCPDLNVVPEIDPHGPLLGLPAAPGHLIYIGSGAQLAKYGGDLLEEANRLAFHYAEFGSGERRPLVDVLRAFFGEGRAQRRPGVILTHRYCSTRQAIDQLLGRKQKVARVGNPEELPLGVPASVGFDPSGTGALTLPIEQFRWVSPDADDASLGFVKTRSRRKCREATGGERTLYREQICAGNASADCMHYLDEGLFPAAAGRAVRDPRDQSAVVLDCQVLKMWRLGAVLTDGDEVKHAVSEELILALDRKSTRLCYIGGTGDIFIEGCRQADRSPLFSEWIGRHHVAF